LLWQCTDAREMSWGNDNLDGWGVAWRDEDGEPRRYRSSLPLTRDAAGIQRLAGIKSDRSVVHVRQKTPGSLTDESNSAPFWDGDATFFCHNGYVESFRDGVADLLLGRLSPHRRAALEGDTDSEVLFALVLDRIDRGYEPADALRTIAEVGDEFGGRFNVVLWTASTMIATRWRNSLYLREDDGVVITSEPLDDELWTPVPERSMVVVDDQGPRLEAW
jgi:glutamine amidotransferase